MKRVICWLTGHRWDVIALNVRKSINLGHLSRVAGHHAICERCGVEINDLFGFPDDRIIYPSRTAKALPAARSVPR